VKKPTEEQIKKIADKVLDAALVYGNKAAIADYSDDEEGNLLGLAYKYAELRRLDGSPEPKQLEPKETRSVVVTIKGVEHHFWVDEAKEALRVLQQALRKF
jgi:hypothetical protein